MEIIDIAQVFLTSLSGAAALGVIISGYINTHALSASSSQVKQIVSWAVAVGIAFGAHALGAGIFAGLSIVWTAIMGLAVGLVSNGIFDVSLVQSMLNLIGAHKRRKA